MNRLLVVGAFLSLALGCSGGTGTVSDAASDVESTTTPTAPTADDPLQTDAPQVDLDALRAEVARNPSDPQAIGRLAVALFETRQVDEAVELFERLVEVNPGTNTLLNLGRAYVQLSRYPEAEATYNRLLELQPGQPVALHSLGNIAMRRGETEKAIAYYQQAIERRPDYVLAHFHLGDALKESQRYREAYTTFGKVLSLDPKDAQELEAYDDALYEMASLDITMGAHDRAAQMLEELIRANPDHKSAYYAYGQALLQLGRPDEAQQAFERHLEIRSKIKSDSPMAMGD